MNETNGKTMVVSLVSEQTIPNVQFLKWYFSIAQDDADLLFISTESMEKKGKSECIRNAMPKYLNLKNNNSDILLVDSDDISLIREKIEDYFSTRYYDKVVVNITGGTKMMSMAAYNFFVEMDGAEIYYLPLGKSIQMIYPEHSTMAENIELTLSEYMKAHGIRYNADNHCVKDWIYNQNVLEKVEKYRDDIKVLVAIQESNYIKRQFSMGKKIDFSTMDEKYLQTAKHSLSREVCCTLFEDFGFEPSNISRRKLKYITGGWFEEYIYQWFLNNNDGKICPDNIALNVSIERGNDRNELDVVFLDRQNRFNVLECKSFVDGVGGEKILNDALYKLQAIIKSKFGLNIKSGICTMSDVDKESALNRAGDFNIEVFDRSRLLPKKDSEI